jgi:3-hydroxy acid dehydrogenase/malonic semialdehyde reductase
MGSFDNKIVMVTGATSGFGETMTRRFVAEGARVIATGRRADRLHALAHELGAAVHPLPFDMRDNDAMAAAISGLPSELLAIDILINNAGLARGLSSAHEADLDDWLEMIDTNIKGLVLCTRAILPGMVTRGRGHIVNLGSVAGAYPYPGANVYGASKAFVHQFTLNLKADLAGNNIRMTSIEPGAAETEFSLVRFHGDQAKSDATYAGLEALQPEDVADAVIYAVSAPAHVNVNRIELMCTNQSFGAFVFTRDQN